MPVPGGRVAAGGMIVLHERGDNAALYVNDRQTNTCRSCDDVLDAPRGRHGIRGHRHELCLSTLAADRFYVQGARNPLAGSTIRVGNGPEPRVGNTWIIHGWPRLGVGVRPSDDARIRAVYRRGTLREMKVVMIGVFETRVLLDRA